MVVSEFLKQINQEKESLMWVLEEAAKKENEISMQAIFGIIENDVAIAQLEALEVQKNDALLKVIKTTDKLIDGLDSDEVLNLIISKELTDFEAMEILTVIRYDVNSEEFKQELFSKGE